MAVAYFSPNNPNQQVAEFLDTLATITHGWEEDTIILGDFNARHTAFGDTMDSARGNVLRAQIELHRLVVQEPVVGKFTSFKNGGAGIPDLVITAGVNTHGLTVHEKETLGGSDHRPLTFAIDAQTVVGRHIERWHVRKLAEQKTQERSTYKRCGRKYGKVSTSWLKFSSQHWRRPPTDKLN